MKNILVLLFLVFSAPAVASTPLVNSEWLQKHLHDDDVFLLDIRSKDFFDYARIPGSIYSDYGKWRQPQSKILRKMLPTKDQLEQLLSNLGINNSSHIVIISAGQSAGDLAAASRVYWTLEQIGHAKKSILEGGIIAWAEQRLPLTREKYIAPEKSQYQIASIAKQTKSDDVLKAIKDNEQLIDTRSFAEFKGIIHTDDERGGTITSSKPLPYDWFSNKNSGQLHSLKNINNIVNSIQYDNSKPTIVYCHTGHRAALSWFVLHELLGNKQTKLYDGSTRDWSTQSSTPLTQEINVEN